MAAFSAYWPIDPPVTQTPVAAQANAASVTTAGITTTSGNLLVAVMTSFGDHIGASPITDSLGNIWLPAVAKTGVAAHGFIICFYVQNCIGGVGHTFTFTGSSAGLLTITVLEIQGAATSGVLGNVNSATATSTNFNSGNVTSDPTLPCLLLGAISLSSSVAIVTMNKYFQGFKWLSNGAVEGLLIAYRITPANTTDSFTVSVGSSLTEGIMCAAFKANAVAPVSGGSGGSFVFTS